MHLGLNGTGLLCPISIYGSPVTLLKFLMAPKLRLLMSYGFKKNEPRYACQSEAKTSHSKRMWAEVSSSAQYRLLSGRSHSPIRWRCLLRVLCPMRWPVTILDYVQLKDRNPALAPRQGHEISSRGGHFETILHISRSWPASWSSGQSLCLLIMRSRVRFPVLPWKFSLKGTIPAVTMVWVGW